MKNLNKYFYSFFLLLFSPGYVIVYGQLNAGFSASATTGCTPVGIKFTDLSTGNPTVWFWNFGNGFTSTQQNPVTTYINSGRYTVRLIIKNASGENYVEKENYITVSPTPKVALMPDKSSGCLPLSVNFQNNTNLFGSGIKSWFWDFGDGSTAGSQNASHLYNNRGVYDVTLSAENLQGCKDTFKITGAVRAGNKPANVSFKASPLDGCASQLRNFTDLSSGKINSWQWNFGDKGTDNIKKPSYHYTDTGWFSVKLIVADNGCADSVQYNHYMHVIGPVANMFPYVKCIDPYNIDFIDRSKGAKSWYWDFGDGATSTLRSPKHTYNSPGVYNATLSVSAGACIDTTINKIYIVDQKPAYKINPLKNNYCKNDSIEFIVTNYDSSLTQSFAWSFDGGITQTFYRARNSSFKTVFNNTGIYTPVLYAINKESCHDTVQQASIKIIGPTASFTSSSPACSGSVVSFSDQSIPNNNFYKKEWNYGDGDSLITTSSQADYKYPFPGLYNVSFKITDADGCSDTISHMINISDTPTIDAGNDTFICAGKSVTLKPTGGASFTWDNNEFLSCTNCTNPIAAPSDTTRLFVTGKNAAGCSARDSIKINVQQQETLTVQPLTGTICAGNSVQLLASGYNSYQWQPAISLNNANVANPVASPTTSTVYTVTATDKSGCFSTLGNINIVANPKPIININNSEVILQPGAPVQINTTSSADVIKWQWQPPQWLSDASIANPVAQPLQSITYTVYAATASGCVSLDSITIIVLCNNSILYVPNTFSPNNDGVNDYFYPRSKAPVTIKSLKIFNRWGQEIYNRGNFASNDQASGWDGTYRGVKQQADGYVYIMQLACANGSMFTKQGSISLIR